jgi:hypothetical protein
MRSVTANKHTLRCCHVCSSSVTEKIAFRTGGSKTRFVCAEAATAIDEDGGAMLPRVPRFIDEYGDVVLSCVSRFMRWEADHTGGTIEDQEKWERDWWRLLGSCAICAVPVYGNACAVPGFIYLENSFVESPYCSEQCRRALISQRAKAARAAKRGERPCEACGRLFVPTRSDAKTCSNRCRQAAHRQHKRGAVWLSNMMRADGEPSNLAQDKEDAKK